MDEELKKKKSLIALFPTVNHSVQTCNTVPNPQVFCFLAVLHFHIVIIHQ